jgi:hypothetical protein
MDWTNIPPWSEGSDAIGNANATLADAISRTGLGLQSCPGVELGKPWIETMISEKMRPHPLLADAVHCLAAIVQMGVD